MSSDRDARADAFVLGLLDDMETAERALESDRDWAAAVGRARDRLLALDLTAPEVVVDPALWQGVQLAPAAPALRAANLPAAPRHWRSLVAAAAGIVLGIAIGSRWFAPDPMVVAVLMDDTGRATAVVEDFGSARAVIRFVSQVEVPQGRQMQVWTLPSVEAGPVSLGLLETATGDSLDMPRLPAPKAGQLYEITFEPEGGSPTGRPTGPILAKGLAAAQDGV